MSIGKFIKAARIEAGISQRELAERVGCAEITIRQYELSKRRPDDERINSLFAALHVTERQLAEWFHSYYPNSFNPNSFDDSKLATAAGWLGCQIAAYFENHNDGDLTPELFERAIHEKMTIHQVDQLDEEGLRFAERALFHVRLLDSDGRKKALSVLSFMQRLNHAGQEKAVERVEELTEIPKYQRDPDQD